VPGFDAGILQRWGETFIITANYYAASICPCNAKNGGTPDPQCSQGCTLGWQYADPVACEIIRTSPNLRAIPQEIATIFIGGARITIPELLKSGEPNPAFVNVHRGDVFSITRFPERHSDVLLRGTRDKLWAFDVQSLVLIRDEDGVEYAEGGDFLLSDGELLWESGRGPAVGKYYSCEFVAATQFIIYMTQATHRGGDGTGAVLPKTVLAVRRAYQPSTVGHPLSPLARGIEMER
jgi:hypothetical protein